MAELVRMTRSKSLVVDRVGKENSREGYFRQYYERNKDKDVELRSANAASKAAYARLHYLEHKDKKAEYQNRNREWIEDSKRRFDVRSKLTNGEVEFEHVGDSLDGTDGRGEALAEYRRQYNLSLSGRNRELRRKTLADYRSEKKKRRRHNLEKDERKPRMNRNPTVTASKAAYDRQYYFQHKGKFLAEYGQEYSGNSTKVVKRRLYFHGRKEQARAYYGSQRTVRSWKTPELVRNYLDSLAPRLEISNFEDWYRISRKQMAQFGGLGLYKKFRTLGAALQFAYPEFTWDLPAFRHRGNRSGTKLRPPTKRKKTRLSWKTPEAVREYFDSVAPRLDISSYEDWYRISYKQITRIGGVHLYALFALQYAYPDINWDLNAFSHRGKKSYQRWLKLKIKELLPGIDIVEGYQHPDLNWVADSDQKIELDVWVPQHRIGIEYQGQQHYYNIDSLGPSSAAGAYSERDTLKSSLCESRGITLIAIPYWWDGSMESLSATLYQARPDVFPVSHGRPIPREMPVLSRANSEEQLGGDSGAGFPNRLPTKKSKRSWLEGDSHQLRNVE